MSSPRYAVGIDLGTTNSALAFVDLLQGPQAKSRIVKIPHSDHSGNLVEQSTLPSVLQLENGWRHDPSLLRVGTVALQQISLYPERIIVSAKSWLSHSAVNRSAAILPWSSSYSEAISPVEASTAILQTIRLAWDQAFAKNEAAYRLENQIVVITVPASFDEIAQQLTLTAAHAAGIPNARLLEEPQAAFYRWLEREPDARSLPRLERASTVIVIDIGGGTTDLSLFSVNLSTNLSRNISGAEVQPMIERLRVSDHLLLGGDNIDLAITEFFTARFEQDSVALSTRQREALRIDARAIKERCLSSESPVRSDEELRVALSGEGSALFRAARSIGFTRSEILSVVLDGFFPEVENTEKSQRSSHALRAAGLPYASDARITAHIAEFLAGDTVDAILFNGGTLTSPLIRSKIVTLISRWQRDHTPVTVLENPELDLAVARGAAWFGAISESGDAHRSNAHRINAGYPRSLYLELYSENRRDAPQLLCIVPKGFASLRPVVVSGQKFSVTIGKSVRFQIWSSLHREADKFGCVVTLNKENFNALPPLFTKLELPSGARAKEISLQSIEVELAVVMRETGVCEILCNELNATSQQSATEWRLTFDTRKQEQSKDLQEVSVSAGIVQLATEKIDRIFGKRRTEGTSEKPRLLWNELEQVLAAPREQWELPLLRRLWPALARGGSRRGRSAEHEELWFALAGFLLRPGYGVELDGVRIDELWQACLRGPLQPQEARVTNQFWVMLRRVVGGLNGERQLAVYKLLAEARLHPTPQKAEAIKAMGVLERLAHPEKESLAFWMARGLLDKRYSKVHDVLGWSLGRLLLRTPLYGELDTVLSPRIVTDVWREIKALDWKRTELSSLARLLPYSAEMTGDPRRDLSSEVRDDILNAITRSGLSPQNLTISALKAERGGKEATFLFGDTLPSGISAVASEKG